MGRIHNEEFKRKVVRIALTSGLKRRQVESDLKIGHSTLAKWTQKCAQGAKVKTCPVHATGFAVKNVNTTFAIAIMPIVAPSR